jgi:hypothetical protein
MDVDQPRLGAAPGDGRAVQQWLPVDPGQARVPYPILTSCAAARGRTPSICRTVSSWLMTFLFQNDNATYVSRIGQGSEDSDHGQVFAARAFPCPAFDLTFCRTETTGACACST